MSNIKRYTSIYKRSLATKLGRVVAYEKRLLHRKFILPSYDHVRSLDELKHYISTCTRLMATRSYNVVAENKGQQTTKWYDHVVTWSYLTNEKHYIDFFEVYGYYPQTHMTLWSYKVIPKFTKPNDPKIILMWSHMTH